jgi:hypothetical protein
MGLEDFEIMEGLRLMISKINPKFTYYIHSLSSKNNDFPRDFNFIILHVIINNYPNLHGSPFI